MPPATSSDLEENRRGRMSWRQRKRFLLVGLLLVTGPIALGVETLVIARTAGIHVNGANFYMLFVMLPFTGIVLLSLGTAALLEGLFARCSTTEGVPETYRWESPRHRRGRTVLIAGRPAPFPSKDYDAVVGHGRAVRIYRTKFLRSLLSWEFVPR